MTYQDDLAAAICRAEEAEKRAKEAEEKIKTNPVVKAHEKNIKEQCYEIQSFHLQYE